jgi:excisionase family DNA binding protein
LTAATQSPTRKVTRPPAAYHVNEACELLRIARSTLTKLSAEGAIRTIKLGGRVLVPAIEIDRILAGEAQQ